MLSLGGLACDSPPSATDLPEWQAADHDKEPNAAAGQEQQKATPSGGAAGGAAGRAAGPDMVVEASWQQQCAACHGAVGHGDGPTGPMVHAADLTLTAWQGTVTDAQIADVIAHGKGKMPPFDLPPKVVAGLVARIRASRGH
jgi:mono/diheme cytochrome c family protein